MSYPTVVTMKPGDLRFSVFGHNAYYSNEQRSWFLKSSDGFYHQWSAGVSRHAHGVSVDEISSSTDPDANKLPNGKLTFTVRDNHLEVEGVEPLLNLGVDEAVNIRVYRSDRRTIEWVWDAGDFYIILDRPKSFSSYNDYALYIGSAKAPMKQKIETFSRMRDGGTTHITLSSGDTIVSPSALYPDRKALFNDEPVEVVSKDEYTANRHPQTQELVSLYI